MLDSLVRDYKTRKGRTRSQTWGGSQGTGPRVRGGAAQGALRAAERDRVGRASTPRWQVTALRGHSTCSACAPLPASPTPHSRE